MALARALERSAFRPRAELALRRPCAESRWLGSRWAVKVLPGATAGDIANAGPRLHVPADGGRVVNGPPDPEPEVALRSREVPPGLTAREVGGARLDREPAGSASRVVLDPGSS